MRQMQECHNQMKRREYNENIKRYIYKRLNGAENCKIILGIRMPDGTKEIIINDNVQNKVDYVCTKYDDDLKMHGADSN